MDEILFSSSTDEWGTPATLFDQISAMFGPFDLDPCATRANRKADHWFGDRRNDGHQPIFTDDSYIDGLHRHWRAKDGSPANVFVNPPFCREKKMYVDPWVDKAWTEVSLGHARQVVILIPARTDVRYWHNTVFPHAALVYFIKARVKFDGGSNSATFPSAIVVFRPGFTPRPHFGTWVQP
jgi:site-specific DNA-methyltransferase (adenine-specific)